ncbi:ATP-binding protein [Paenibacillus sp. YN15]|uniref:ATP-binding protein n=1 Tax=Paenibacillus sp. YN15 TaxID=1742774 RepID=UPI000DCD15F7|nr:4Fe-4S dicluster domain-containing protein [Paenibacillus sp. YN15]RAV05642.1 ferredoxin [Paenibacillus sp. YN15]
MKRSIIHIHEELCNGCALCVDACHEGAIEIVNGKAVLISDIYCDGLGACLPNCPTGAIEILEREAEAFDEAAVEERLARMKREETLKQQTDSRGAMAPGGHHGHHEHAGHHAHHHGHQGMGGCPGSMARKIERPASTPVQEAPKAEAVEAGGGPASELQQWPVQISLVNPSASFFQDAHLLVAADCTAFAYARFHQDFIRGRITVIGCPKLDDNAYYAEKLAVILKQNNIQSITVVRMSVPCCGGIVQAVKQAMLASQTIVPYREVTVGIDGQLIS